MNKKMREQFRDYESDARPSVREFYRLNNSGQTLEFVRRKRKEHLGLNRCEMGIWAMAEYLNALERPLAIEELEEIEINRAATDQGEGLHSAARVDQSEISGHQSKAHQR